MKQPVLPRPELFGHRQNNMPGRVRSFNIEKYEDINVCLGAQSCKNQYFFTSVQFAIIEVGRERFLAVLCSTLV